MKPPEEDAYFENMAYASQEKAAYEAMEREAYEHKQRLIAEHEAKELAKTQPSPAQQPCRTCVAFFPQPNGKPWCKELNDQVQGWWTGCIRWKPNDQVEVST